MKVAAIGGATGAVALAASRHGVKNSAAAKTGAALGAVRKVIRNVGRA